MQCRPTICALLKFCNRINQHEARSDSSFLCLNLVPRNFAAARSPVYVVLWFDTEDYVDPIADDAALRIAQDLDRLGVRATFKVVGEKARTLEARGRRDVIRALAHHDIGYHAENHSIPPAPSVYLRDLDWLDGAAEFARREGRGVVDIRRIFGVTPSCYGQPGSSWGPQSYPALLRMRIPVYLDEEIMWGSTTSRSGSEAFCTSSIWGAS
jgi:hypothetical protein